MLLAGGALNASCRWGCLGVYQLGATRVARGISARSTPTVAQAHRGGGLTSRSSFETTTRRWDLVPIATRHRTGLEAGKLLTVAANGGVCDVSRPIV